MKAQARAVESQQSLPHEDLIALVNKHRKSEFKRPFAEHTKEAFAVLISYLSDWQGPVILDVCCGVGESTLGLAARYPQARVIGIDKSAARLKKHEHYKHSQHEKLSNHIVLQADLNDFWRLLSAYLHDGNQKRGWHIQKQYLLYPNPYPKKSQVGKRWHAGPVFKDMLACCANIELRSNWRVYVEEFVLAAECLGVPMALDTLSISDADQATTPFERKYLEANQTLWTAYTLGMGCDK